MHLDNLCVLICGPRIVQVVKIHPGSALCDKKVPAIVYDELVSACVRGAVC